MAHKAILLIDLLGVQRMWQQGGAPRVKARITEFNNFVLKQFNFLSSELSIACASHARKCSPLHTS